MANDSYYESFIHSLSHEHTKLNIERHILGYEKWCRKFCDGIYICDLDNVITLVEILEERLQTHPSLFEPILLSFLDVCSKTLLESKGNERLRSIGMERIKRFYSALARFTLSGSINCRIACVKTFRCILNAGVDPSLIHETLSVAPKENCAPIVDKIYIQNLFRDSGAVQIIASELYNSYVKYSSNLKEVRSYQEGLTMSLRKQKKSVSGQEDFENEESPGDPAPAISSSYDPDDMSVTTNTEKSFQQLKDSTFEYGEYCKLLVDLCLEISVDAQSACIMCLNGYACNALIIAISEELLNNRPDHLFISKLIELLWNCVENYVGMIQAPSDINPTPASPSMMHVSASLTTLNPSQSQGVLSNQTDIIKFQFAIPTLRQLLRKLVFNGYCHSDKEIRNEVIIICNLFLSFPKSIPYFILSGLLNDIVTFATYGEMGRKGWTFYSQPLPKLRNFSTFTEIDIQLKKELWLLISELLAYDDQDIITCVASSSFMNVLFHYLEQSSLENDTSDINDEELIDRDLEGNDNDILNTPTGINKSILNKTTTLASTRGKTISPSARSPRDDVESSSLGSISSQRKSKTLSNSRSTSDKNKLPTTQLIEIQILAMAILAGNAHRMMAEFIQIDGPRRALTILCQYSSSTQPDHKTLVYHTFLLLNRCLVSSSHVNEMLIELNGLEIFLYYFDNSDENLSRAQAIKLLTAMCQSSLECQKHLRDLGGIECLVKALVQFNERKVPLVGKTAGVKFVTLAGNDGDKYPLNDENGGEMNPFAISLLSCIWKSIVGNKYNEIVFAEKEGVDALFDMLEVSTFLIRSMILRLLSDLLQNKHLVTYAYAWRSFRTVRSIGQLLAHCWMDEEVRLNCVRGSDGVICNIWNILGNHSWPTEILPPDAVFTETGEMMVQSSSASQMETVQSQTVKRLSSAILASRAGSTTQVQSSVRTKVLALDLRGIITTIFQSLGFLEVPVVSNDLVGSDEYLSYVYDEVALDKQESKPKSGRTFLRSLSSMGADAKPVIINDEDMADQNLSPTDKQVISICMRYDTLREGEWWNKILEDLKQENIIPIDADLNMIEDMKERLFASARAIQFEQMELSVIRQMEKQSEEDVFFNHIIQQKNQQIKSEYLKRKSGRKN